MASETARRWRNLFWAAADGVVAHRVRLFTSVGSVAVCLFPLISALAVSEGLRTEAQETLRGAADLFVAGDDFGVDATVDPANSNWIATLPGVAAVVPRVVGRLSYNDTWVTVVGVDREAMAGVPKQRRGHVPETGELFIGASLSDELGFRAGKMVLLEAELAAVFSVAEVFARDSGVGSARTMLMNRQDATELFQEPDKVSELLVYCRPGYAGKLAETISKESGLRVQTKSIVSRYLDRAYHLRSGALLMLYAAALVLALPAFLLLADLGGGARRREIGLLKATGWTTQEVLIMNLIESWLIAFAGGVIAVLLAFLFVGILGAPLLRGLFVPGAFATVQGLALPYRLGGLAVTMAFVVAALLTSLASILSVWRSTVLSPSQAMRNL